MTTDQRGRIVPNLLTCFNQDATSDDKLSLAAQTNKVTLFDNLLQDKPGVSAQMVWPRFELGTDAPGREFSKTYSFF